MKYAVLMSLVATSSLALAHGEERAKNPAVVKKEQKPWGIAGDAKRATRTVEVRTLDTMRFAPDRVDVKQGETIRFVQRNDGKLIHEFVLGTKKELEAHAMAWLKT